QLRLQLPQGRSPQPPRHLEGIKPHPVQLERQSAQGAIPALADLRDDLPRSLAHGGISRAVAPAQKRAALAIQLCQGAAKSPGLVAHGISLSIRVTRMPSHPSALSAEIVR